MSEDKSAPEMTPDELQALEQQTLATFNSAIIGTFRHMLNMKEVKQHAALFAAARAIGELAALSFGQTERLMVDISKAMLEHAALIKSLSKEQRDHKLQQLIIRVKEQLGAQLPGAAGSADVGPKLILPKRMRRH